MKAIFRIGLLLCLISAPAYGTVMYYLEVEDLARLSSDIFRGRVLSTRTYWNDERTRIYTAVRVQVDDGYKGRAGRGQTVTVTQLGGEIGGIRMDYAGRPVFEAGDAVLLFTVRGRRDDYIVTGLKQGRMSIEGEHAVREFSGIRLIGRQVPSGTVRIPLSEVRARISRAGR